MTIKNLVNKPTDEVIKSLLNGLAYREMYLVEFGSDCKVEKVVKLEEHIIENQVVYVENPY